MKSSHLTLFSLFCLITIAQDSSDPCRYGYYPKEPTECWFTTNLDHFCSKGSSPTFSLRYLVNAEYWSPQSGPILFYAGNEGDVWGFYENSGFLTQTLAERFQGLLVFAEHRYFGQSFPFEGEEEALDEEHNKWLTVDQAMMDYVELVKEVKRKYAAEQVPVVVVGGSYGGMLAAWLRMKYPHVFVGAFSSSAPILYFRDQPDVGIYDFYDLIGQVFEDQEPNMPSIVKEGWSYITTASSDDYSLISSCLNTCSPISSLADLYNLYYHLMSGYSFIAMTNYPYPTNFLMPMPGYPVNEAAAYFNGMFADPIVVTDERKQLVLETIYKSTNVYYNYLEDPDYCTDFDDSEGTGNLEDAGWNLLACNQLTMPMSNGPDSLFLEDEFDFEQYSEYCQEEYGLQVQYYWALDFFGGWNVELDFSHLTNIIFSNGDLDPWSTGGVTMDVIPNAVVLNIEGAAHHLDLRLPNDEDPQSVIDAREIEIDTIQMWIDEYWEKKSA